MAGRDVYRISSCAPYFVEHARAAYESGALDAAVGYAEQALDFAARFDDPVVRAIASLSAPVIARIFEARVGRLDPRLRVRHTPSTRDRHSLASQRAFLLSHLDAELSLEETRFGDVAPRRDALPRGHVARRDRRNRVSG